MSRSPPAADDDNGPKKNAAPRPTPSKNASPFFEPPPRSEWIPISQGAEARVWRLVCNDGSSRGCDGHDENGRPPPPPRLVVAVCKERFSKAYRHPDLDAKLTKSRCRMEARILERCASRISGGIGGVLRVPRVLRVTLPSLLFLEHLDGDSVRTVLQRHRRRVAAVTVAATVAAAAGEHDPADATGGDDGDVLGKDGLTANDDDDHDSTEDGPTRNNKKQRTKEGPRGVVDLEDLALRMGRMVGQIHNIGVVHGDLTTSNMMLLWGEDERGGETDGAPPSHVGNDNNYHDHGGGGGRSGTGPTTFELALIDFGLAKSTSSVEEQAVDLYVLERALQSTHPDLPESFFGSVLAAYSSTTTTAAAAADAGTTTAAAAEKKKPASSSKGKQNTTQSTLQRLEQVRLRGRKRECFG